MNAVLSQSFEHAAIPARHRHAAIVAEEPIGLEPGILAEQMVGRGAGTEALAERHGELLRSPLIEAPLVELALIAVNVGQQLGVGSRLDDAPQQVGQVLGPVSAGAQYRHTLHAAIAFRILLIVARRLPMHQPKNCTQSCTKGPTLRSLTG